MRTRALLLLVVFIAAPLAETTSYAQHTPHARANLDARRQAEGLLKLLGSATVADAYGVEKATSYYWTGFAWLPSWETLYSYQDGTLREYTDYSLGPPRTPSSRITYNEQGLLELYEMWDESTGAFVPIWRYSYTTTHDTVRDRFAVNTELLEVYVGETWQNSTRTSYTLEQHPAGSLHVTSYSIDIWEVQAWRPIQRTTLAEVGDDVVETSQSRFGDQWTNQDRTTYPGQTLSGLLDMAFALAAQFGLQSELMLGIAQLPDETRQSWNGTTWVNNSRQVTEARHSESGLPSLIRWQDWNGSAWKDESTIQISYVDEGRSYVPSTLMLSDFYTGQEVPSLAERYSYDGRGLLVQAMFQQNYGFGLEDDGRVDYEWISLAVSSENADVPAPNDFRARIFPNPTTAMATVSFELTQAEEVRVRLYDIVGREVRTLTAGRLKPGPHQVTLDGSNLPGGVYLVGIETPATRRSYAVAIVR